MRRVNPFLVVALGTCVVLAGCGSDAGHGESTTAAETIATLQSGETLRGFELCFINRETNWRVTTDPIRIRISDSEKRSIAREELRGVRVEDIERDPKGHVERLQVVLVTGDEEISGWSFPLGAFAFQLHVSPEEPLSMSELESLFVKEVGFHLNPEVRDVDGQQLLRIPLAQIESLTLPDGAVGSGIGAKL